MNDKFWENPDLLVLSGSHLYGYSTPESDKDYIGFVLPPLGVEIGMINRFEQKTPSQEELDKGEDQKIYSLRKFLNQLTRNDTQCLEILFAPESHIEKCTTIGETIINNRNLFISKQLYKRFVGYAYSEFRKVRGVAFVPEKQTPNEQKILDQIRNCFNPSKKNMDLIIDMLYENQPKKEVSVYRQLGKQRKNSINKFEYSVKNASHCIRLLMEGIEILNTGNIVYPFNEQKISTLRKIRAGETTFKEVEDLFNCLMEEIKNVAGKSKLPQNVNMKRVNDLFVDLTLRFSQKNQKLF